MHAGLFFAISLGLCCGTVSAADAPYDGSRDSFLRFLADHQLSDWALPEWSTGAVIGFFEAPDGVRLRYAYWPRAAAAPARGTVVHFNGRTEFIERNVHTYRDLAERGWDVWTVDWRGQGLSHRPLDASDGPRGHIDSFDTYLSDAKRFVDQVVKPNRTDESQEILLGHSMGGQIALRYMIAFGGDFDKLMLSSPLVRLPGGAIGTAVVDVKAELPIFNESCVITKPGDWQSSFQSSACMALKAHDPASQLRNITTTHGYTHDARSLAASECLVEQSVASVKHPGLEVACPTDSWLGAAGRSTNDVFAHRDKLTMPILIVAAKADPAVDPEGQRDLCRALPNCTLVQVPDAGHELLIETPAIRTAFLKCFDAFAADARTGSMACDQIVKGITP